jgi:drug/metabolite transporter (DMT)-like permease
MANEEWKSRASGISMLLGASLLWGVAFVAQSAGMEYIGPFTFTAVRSAISAIGLMGMFMLFDRLGISPKTTDRKRLWKAGILLGLIMFFANNLQQVGMLYTSVGKAGFITSLYIVFVPMIGMLVKRRPHPCFGRASPLRLSGCISFRSAAILQWVRATYWSLVARWCLQSIS